MDKKEKILIYSGKSYVFRSTIIGYLHEISQNYPVVLVSEELDRETKEIINDKKLFPKLEKIIPLSQFDQTMGLFLKNRYLFERAERIIKQIKPAAVVVPTDFYPFELYLLRISRKLKILNISVQPSNAANGNDVRKWVDLINLHVRFPFFFPKRLKIIILSLRKTFGHFLYYWIFPISVGTKPFTGKSSYILRRGNSGMRDSDFQTVFSKRDRDIYFSDGVPEEKLYILKHPLKRRMKSIFRKVYLHLKKDRNFKIITLMLPDDTTLGFDKDNYSLIAGKRERQEDYIKIIKTISKVLSGWKIYVKIHPDHKSPEKIKKELEAISKNVVIIDKNEIADKIIEISDVIVGLPLSTSTVLFTASLQCPEKPILSLDFHRELLGDYYKNFEGIEYVDSRGDFIKILKLIKSKKYRKEVAEKNNDGPSGKEFSNSAQMICELLKQKTKNGK